VKICIAYFIGDRLALGDNFFRTFFL